MINTDECMLWAGATTRNGYGIVTVKRNGKWTTAVIHRELYLVEVGDIADDLVLDHLCRNRACINMTHLEPVTNAENIKRGAHQNRKVTSCKQGHEYTEVNTIHTKDGRRNCRECNRANSHRQYQKRKAINVAM